MKKCFIFAGLLLFAVVFSFSQQNLPRKIIGQIPAAGSAQLYQIQVGAFKSSQNAENASLRLKREGFNPVQEKYRDYTRVMITGVCAKQVRNYLASVKKIGFDEVIIREDSRGKPANVNIAKSAKIEPLSEKWEVITPDSFFLSIEFNKDNNFIAAGNPPSEGADNPVYFGKYAMLAKDVIDLGDLGVLRIREDNIESLKVSFSPKDEPNKEINFIAVRAKRMAESQEIDLFCRTWKVVKCTRSEDVGMVFFISNTGTYFFTTPNGETHSMSEWRWYDSGNKEFEYTSDDWAHYGRVVITKLTKDRMEFNDPGFYNSIPGYSSAGLNILYELEPVNN